MTDFKIGQKWISNAEPELGMGRIMHIENRMISLYFDMAREERRYASAQAPLTRVRFNPGDRIMTQDDIVITVESVVEQNGIYVYHGRYQGTSTAVVETELDANVRFSKPEDRLFTRQIDDNRWFNLRYRSLTALADLARSKSRGLYGPRVSLIPHQLYIANEVASRFAPRVLLADEVGLGKTIEAGMIVHQQLQTGRASRILVIVPPALTFQWFVEMIRRFNMRLVVMDEERCLQIIADNSPEPEDIEEEIEPFNPFEAQQMMLCSLDLFLDNPNRLEQALEAEWDLVVVDEAHHLRWSPDEPSMEYRVVDLISRVSKGLLLLTATPEQLGRTGHFARLRLLDPDRFHDYDDFVAEEERFEQIVQDVNLLLDGSDEDKDKARDDIRRILGFSADAGDDELIRALLDRHGTGRVLFRNVRSSVEGFPQRIPEPVTLPCPDDYRHIESFFPEAGVDNWTAVDPRVGWLVELLKDRPADKFLVICAHQDTAVALEKFIAEQTTIRSSVFHEGLDLVARDRAATYFAETDKGAQVLVCSEIGSEGRNFQFAHNLVLFDLPLGPDLLEQRIGRLDRIGQLRDVHIHIPYIESTPMEALYRWYADGIDAFSSPNPAGQSVYDELGDEIGVAGTDALIERTRQLNADRRDALNRGRDRLLELNSHRPEVSARIVDDIVANEGGEALESYMELSFDMWGLESEPLDDYVFSVRPTERMERHVATSIETLGHYHFPELPEDGIRVTYDRDTALAREDVNFFTWEHPMVSQALDIALTDVIGNSAMIAVKHPDLPSGTLLLEVLHVVDCVAPASLDIDRFLPPQVLRSVISPNRTDVADRLPWTDFGDRLLDVAVEALHKLLDSQMDGIRSMLDTARERAGSQLETLRNTAENAAAQSFDQEIARLSALRKVNDTIRPEEVDHLVEVRGAVLDAIRQADIRLDAIRVIVAA